MKLTSQELQQAQNVLEQLATNEIFKPMTNYSKLNRLTKVISDVDSIRRKVWNHEKFGASEATVDETMTILNMENKFTADDIPF